MPDIWIQLENRAWDVSPFGIDRMTGQNVAAAAVARVITSPETGVSHTRMMWKPLIQDALILRRYTENWAAPADRKVNPWDLNEIDPTDNGTMGTIPGPVIECALGETMTVHFRNKDSRSDKAVQARTHSLHPHGFVFDPRYDGAYPLSPPDPSQPVGSEAALWAAVGVMGAKRGDRVPPGGTFTYTWQTIGWQTTAGVWLYHDHSICDMENVQLGAIGLIVIHNPADPEDVVVGSGDLPVSGDFNSSPLRVRCFPFPTPVPILQHQLIDVGRVTRLEQLLLDTFGASGTGVISGGGMSSSGGMSSMNMSPSMPMAAQPGASDEAPAVRPRNAGHDDENNNHDVVLAQSIVHGATILELNKELTVIARFCLRFYRTPPGKAQYLLLFHNLTGAEMCINGRKYLGNTPTVIAGPQTEMRFGVVGMGNVDGFHTFHLHGHRWTLNGPHGNNRAAIQSSVQDTPISQFEDTRTFGPANSFAFSIKEGTIGGLPSFMGPPPGAAVGEWHMHCHVLNHMMDGMMGSLLVVNGGETATTLPRGVPCPSDVVGGGGTPHTVRLHPVGGDPSPVFDPQNITIAVGDTVHWQWADSQPHSSTSDTGIWDSGVHTGAGFIFDHTFGSPGAFPYHCSIHGAAGGLGMAGTVTVI
ncbi:MULTISPECIES: multicopper oxidase domain-containing protein [Paraburkholderia]|uniref:multicopper oxidase domain-containing protein n=1 Tax=Paraburkholderia TaxID=1822464 RepID=UPI0038B9CFDA